MPGYAVVTLPTMTQSSSAVDTSTMAVPSWDVSDASAVTIICNAATTAPGPQVQIALTSDSTATFTPLAYWSTTPARTLVVTSSATAMVISPVAYKQMRVISTSVITGTGSHSGAKAIVV